MWYETVSDTAGVECEQNRLRLLIQVLNRLEAFTVITFIMATKC